MDLEIRHPTEDDLRAVFALRAQAFNAPAAELERQIPRLPLDRMLVAYVGARLVGTVSLRPFGQFFGGREVPMGGVAAMAVDPAHRGHGIARRLLISSLELLRERGEAISTLFPATTRLYRSMGWELAGTWGQSQLPTRALRALPDGDPRGLRRGSLEDLGLIAACHARVAPTMSGWVSRSDPWWQRRLAPLTQEHHYLYLVERDGRADGYVLYDHGSDAKLIVRELVATTRDSLLSLWRMLAEHASIFQNISLQAAPEEPLLLLLPEQELTVTRTWKWMTRLVDAPSAIAMRGFPARTWLKVSLDLQDEAAPWNRGHWELEVEGGRGGLKRGGDGRVRLDINALSSLYTGWAQATALARAGLMNGPDEDLAALDHAFCGPTPWLLDFF